MCAPDETPPEPPGLVTFLRRVVDRRQQRVELVVQPLDDALVGALVWRLGVLGPFDRQVATLVEDDRRRLAEIQDGIRRGGGDRTHLVQAREFLVREADPLAPEDETGRRRHVP
jgi:hypothetical protein